jgi:hypothetical protein
MSLSFSMSLRNARANAVIAALDSGIEHATAKFYTGAKARRSLPLAGFFC